ncbi:MAG: hypothetical protein FJZ43_01520 [Candidatus Staskawiczbacteria bacterium]|nr:hypothetical protein [Candidatus Staskawiczbacteria bacterium]
MTKAKKAIFIVISIIIFLVVFYITLMYGVGFDRKNVNWGIDFSQMQAEALGLDWQETYLAIINDLGAKNIKLHTQWDFVEGKKDDYYFNDIDWQIQQAEKYNVNIIYVLGLKTGRWPECHDPDWVQGLTKQKQQDEVIEYMTEVVNRYKDSKSIIYWQVENEPLLQFGECPSWYYDDVDFLKKEIDLVRSLDSTRKIIISDSGELSWWLEASKIGDIVGTTMYRKAWVDIKSFGFGINLPNFYGTYPIPPAVYYYKSKLVNLFFGKEVICVELQAEPWASKPIYEASLNEQQKTMNENQFDSNVRYAKKTGLGTFYFWGAEWWYWLKTKEGQPEIWDKAKTLFLK